MKNIIMANYTIIARSVSGFGGTYEVDKYPPQ